MRTKITRIFATAKIKTELIERRIPNEDIKMRNKTTMGLFRKHIEEITYEIKWTWLEKDI